MSLSVYVVCVPGWVLPHEVATMPMSARYHVQTPFPLLSSTRAGREGSGVIANEAPLSSLLYIEASRGGVEEKGKALSVHTNTKWLSGVKR